MLIRISKTCNHTKLPLRGIINVRISWCRRALHRFIRFVKQFTKPSKHQAHRDMMIFSSYHLLELAVLSEPNPVNCFRVTPNNKYSARAMRD